MKVTISTPMGDITADITGGAIGSAEVTPEGGVLIHFYPVDMATEPDEEAFIGD